MTTSAQRIDYYPTHSHGEFRLRVGDVFPFGATLVPNGVNFGPSMPGEPYTGHSEHEFVTREQLLDNLGMVTSLLVDLAVR